MNTILFNAFSFLRKKLKNNLQLPSNINVPKGATAYDLIKQLELEDKDVEAVFINGKVMPFSTTIQDNDRVAFVPYGTPGPYRVFLGFVNDNK